MHGQALKGTTELLSQDACQQHLFAVGIWLDMELVPWRLSVSQWRESALASPQ